MSWNYTHNPKVSIIDKYRLLIGDTQESSPILQDEEIQYYIDQYGDDTNELFYQLFSTVATLYARDIKKSLGPQSQDPTTRSEYYATKAAYYSKLRATSGLSLPKYSHPKAFYRGMNNNPPYPKPGGI